MVALTGFGRKEDVQQAENEGFVAHLTKPFDVEKLLALSSRDFRLKIEARRLKSVPFA